MNCAVGAAISGNRAVGVASFFIGATDTEGAISEPSEAGTLTGFFADVTRAVEVDSAAAALRLLATKIVFFCA